MLGQQETRVRASHSAAMTEDCFFWWYFGQDYMHGKVIVIREIFGVMDLNLFEATVIGRVEMPCFFISIFIGT